MNDAPNQGACANHVPGALMQLRRTANNEENKIANPSEQQKSDEVRSGPYMLVLKVPPALPLRGDSRPFGFAVSRKMCH
jgi:hypothetical protein